MKKITIFFLSVILVSLFFSCASVADRSQDLISRGDYVGAIEMLAGELTRKPDDKKSIPVFRSIYPSHPDRLVAAVAELTAKGSEDTTSAERLVAVYEELVRIQRATIAMPNRLGDGNPVKKYDSDFEGGLARAKEGAAEAFYNEAAAIFPGNDRSEKERILTLYTSANRYSPGFRDSHDKSAQLSYEIGQDYAGGDSISDLEQAIRWFQSAQKWVSGYRDTGSRIQVVSYDLANHLKSEGTVPSYEKAYSFFKLAGNYGNASSEVQIFEFYQKVRSLSNEAVSASGTRLGTTAGASGTAVSVQEQPRTMDSPFTRRATVKAESSAFSIFNPRSDVVYIGAIVDGSSVADQTFRPILASRAPMDITIDLANIAGEATTTIPDPSRYSNAQQAIRRLVTQGTTAPIPVRAEFRSVEVQSEEMLSMALGVGVGKGDVSFTSNTQIDTASKRSSTLIELTQIYYTVNIDIPSTAAEFFAPTGNNVVSPTLLDSTTPYYVSSVTYGRRGYFLIQSNESSRDIMQKFELEKEKTENVPLSTSVSIDTSVTQSLRRSNTTITSHVLGGEGIRANITSLEGIMQWIHEGMDASDNLGSAVPIGFVMRSLKDNGIAVVEQAGEITMPARAQLTVTPVAFQVDYGNNPKSLVRVYMSGGSRMQPDNPSSNPSIRNDGKGWVVGINNGDNFLHVGNQTGQRFRLESRSYVTPIVSGDQKIFLGADFGDRAEVTLLGRTTGRNTWAGYRSTNLTVDDILSRRGDYNTLVNEGWVFRGPDFQGRYFFRFDLELLDD